MAQDDDPLWHSLNHLGDNQAEKSCAQLRTRLPADEATLPAVIVGLSEACPSIMETHHARSLFFSD